MKRMTLTPQIETHLRRSLGAEADLSNIAVFEAIALNTLPLRKAHPIYKDARMDSSVLYEMAAALNLESRPVQVQHDTSTTPIGRVFHGEVVDSSELRVLFFIDGTEEDHIKKVENGTIDQVSVSVLTKQILNSVSGFDYLGPDADWDNFYSGNDGEGNILGQNGVFARLVGLDSFFEMSLVGQGGARNARIVRRDESHFGSSYQKLAASGIDPNAYVLAASATKEPEMDLSELVTKLTSKEVELHTANTRIAELEAQVATLTTKETELTEQVATLTAAAEGQADVAAITKERDDATVALKSVAGVLLTASGKATDALPETVAELSTLIDEAKTGMAAKLIAGGVAEGADRSEVKGPQASLTSQAFRTNRK